MEKKKRKMLVATHQAYLAEQLRKLEEDGFVSSEEVFAAIKGSLSQKRRRLYKGWVQGNE